FESDGKPDGYFSRTKKISHKYENPGVYTVTVEILDEGGLISTTSRQVTVVENTAPFAYFSYTPGTGTTNRIFTFNTKESDDSQYRQQYLAYRFDWNGDGQWDTMYEKKNIWRHKFEVSGTQHVIMEVKDPEGLTTSADAYINVTENVLPHAEFSVEVKEVKVGLDHVRNRYYFDATGSTDVENSKFLYYRWDFNYTGANDISFDTSFSSSPRHSGFYDFPGEKVVRLQVKDEDGAVTDAFMTIVASGFVPASVIAKHTGACCGFLYFVVLLYE
ncbi:MAG TPA: hypothetical protein VI588_00400, partial [Candidatus Gracilibacteria bacterium]|nr:hypothetical protein [Candidatus Gracilibacteria bacterium]